MHALIIIKKLNMTFHVSDSLYRPNGVPDILHDKTVLKIAEKYHGKTTSQVLLRFLIQEGIVPLPKSSKDDRIRSNINVKYSIIQPLGSSLVYVVVRY